MIDVCLYSIVLNYILMSTVCGDVTELGVLYWHLNPNDYENDEELRNIRETRGYNYMVQTTIFMVFNSLLFLL